MDFFEDVAYLVNNNLIDKGLARNTFEDFFLNYFLATEKIMLADRGTDTEYYENVFRLKSQWGPLPKLDMLNSFEKERSMCVAKSRVE